MIRPQRRKDFCSFLFSFDCHMLIIYSNLGKYLGIMAIFALELFTESHSCHLYFLIIQSNYLGIPLQPLTLNFDNF